VPDIGPIQLFEQFDLSPGESLLEDTAAAGAGLDSIACFALRASGNRMQRDRAN
jgi:hypothetical protein